MHGHCSHAALSGSLPKIHSKCRGWFPPSKADKADKACCSPRRRDAALTPPACTRLATGSARHQQDDYSTIHYGTGSGRFSSRSAPVCNSFERVHAGTSCRRITANTAVMRRLEDRHRVMTGVPTPATRLGSCGIHTAPKSQCPLAGRYRAHKMKLQGNTPYLANIQLWSFYTQDGGRLLHRSMKAGQLVHSHLHTRGLPSDAGGSSWVALPACCVQSFSC